MRMMLSTGAEARRPAVPTCLDYRRGGRKCRPDSDGIVRFAVIVYEVVGLDRLAFMPARQSKIRRAGPGPKTRPNGFVRSSPLGRRRRSCCRLENNSYVVVSNPEQIVAPEANGLEILVKGLSNQALIADFAVGLINITRHRSRNII